MKYPWLTEGARVVCVSNDLPRGWGDDDSMRGVEVGSTYTIDEIKTVENDLIVTVLEIPYPPDTDFRSYGFPPSWFKPVLPNTSKTIESLKRAMRDHIKSASGGLGIKRRERA